MTSLFSYNWLIFNASIDTLFLVLPIFFISFYCGNMSQPICFFSIVCFQCCKGYKPMVMTCRLVHWYFVKELVISCGLCSGVVFLFVLQVVLSVEIYCHYNFYLVSEIAFVFAWCWVEYTLSVLTPQRICSKASTKPRKRGFSRPPHTHTHRYFQFMFWLIAFQTKSENQQKIRLLVSVYYRNNQIPRIWI